MRIYLTTFVFLFFINFIYSQKKNFSNYNQKIGGVDYGLDMISINGGNFKMGSPSYEANRMADEGPVHEVYVDSFWMGKFEITWDIFHLFMSREIDKNQASSNVNNEVNLEVDAVSAATTPYVEMSFGMGTDGYPAISMTQLSASKFCEWLSAMTGNYYRLPTEAEWEYACRAGSDTPYSFEDKNQISDYAWYDENSDGKYHKVGEKKPNPWGLHDMHGNVSEWTLDQYKPTIYQRSDTQVSNPFENATKLYPRVARGGSFMDRSYRLRSSARLASNKKWKKQDPQIPRSVWWHTDAQFLGFRVIRPYKTPTIQEQNKYWIK
ncbi:MAG: formylglycine-generating enzyme family protein [Flavobacteriaceae bacterium TMED238]|nr:sulfatase-modifying factor protein [Flavobacteriales bacterium]RPG62781.1 MAG: formylglycine-generating enzyme family protein [Flavobacteriaceae bacterium TMED238]